MKCYGERKVKLYRVYFMLNYIHNRTNPEQQNFNIYSFLYHKETDIYRGEIKWIKQLNILVYTCKSRLSIILNIFLNFQLFEPGYSYRLDSYKKVCIALLQLMV